MIPGFFFTAMEGIAFQYLTPLKWAGFFFKMGVLFEFIGANRPVCFNHLWETPCAEPHAGCCGGWRLETSGYPIIWTAYINCRSSFSDRWLFPMCHFSPLFFPKCLVPLRLYILYHLLKLSFLTLRLEYFSRRNRFHTSINH